MIKRTGEMAPKLGLSIMDLRASRQHILHEKFQVDHCHPRANSWKEFLELLCASDSPPSGADVMIQGAA